MSEQLGDRDHNPTKGLSSYMKGGFDYLDSMAVVESLSEASIKLTLLCIKIII